MACSSGAGSSEKMEDNKKKRNLWREKEIAEMLQIIRENHILKLLDSKTKRNKNIFESIAKEMVAKGFHKNAVQIRAKFKALKSEYYKIKRNNNKSGAQRQTCDYYDVLEELFSHRPAITSEGEDTSVFIGAIEEHSQPYRASECGESVKSSSTDTAPITFKSAKKRNYEKVMQHFSKEWKETQEKLLKEIDEKDGKYLGSVQQLLENNRNETAKMLEDDRKETAKMLSTFLTTLKPQPASQFLSSQQFDCFGNANIASNIFFPRPRGVENPVTPILTDIFSSTYVPSVGADLNSSDISVE